MKFTRTIFRREPRRRSLKYEARNFLLAMFSPSDLSSDNSRRKIFIERPSAEQRTSHFRLCNWLIIHGATWLSAVGARNPPEEKNETTRGYSRFIPRVGPRAAYTWDYRRTHIHTHLHARASEDVSCRACRWE